jgi:hypothetical protein
MATTSSYDAHEARRRLTDLVLRLPRSPRRFDDPRWFILQQELPGMFPAHGPGPILGTGSMGRDDETLLLFVRDDLSELKIDLRVIAQFSEHFGPLQIVFTGPILPAMRPAAGGDSVSGDGPGGDTGTICCLVENDDRDRFILGCNHTLAGVNQAQVSMDTVREPGAADGGQDPGDRFGSLVSYATIQLGGYHRNVIDAAIAEPAALTDAGPGVRGIGPISGVAPTPRHGDRLKKMGWKTGFTTGQVFATIDFTTDLAGQPALFVSQIMILGDDPATGFAQRGDSGAPVLTEDADELAGMVIAVAPQANYGIATPIQSVLDHFSVTPCRG